MIPPTAAAKTAATATARHGPIFGTVEILSQRFTNHEDDGMMAAIPSRNNKRSHLSSGPSPTPTPPTTGGLTITSPAITLTTRHVQAGISKKGDNVAVSQAIVDSLNRVTKGYPLYRQLAFVAHTIWESGSYQYKKELDTANYGNYQGCDWNQDGTQLPNNNKQYYGRGYLQVRLPRFWRH